MNKSAKKNIYRYLPTTPKDRDWGCYVCAAGSQEVSPGKSLFTDPSGHQLWKKRRTLRDYALIYISSGKGVFKSEDTPQINLLAGDVLLLFPNVWHRYRPDPATGWTEQWLIFNGHLPHRLLENNCISSKNPVYHVGVGHKIGDLFDEVIDSIYLQSVPSNAILAGITSLILAHTLSGGSELAEGATGPDQDVISVMAYLEKCVHSDVDMAEIADSLKISSGTLNRHFRKATGLTPHQYHMHLRMSRAKELLEDQSVKIKQIALGLGFHDQYYFSRAFKKHVGCSPAEWRKTVGRGLG